MNLTSTLVELHAMNKTNFSERLKLAHKHKESVMGRVVTQDEVGDAVGLKQQSVGYLMKGGTGSKKCNAFALFYGVETKWLESGTGLMVKPALTPHGTIKDIGESILREAQGNFSAGDSNLLTRITSLNDQNKASLLDHLELLEMRQKKQH